MSYPGGERTMSKVLKDNNGQEYVLDIKKKGIYTTVCYVNPTMLLELLELNINMRFVARLIRECDTLNIIQKTVGELAIRTGVSSVTAKRTMKVLKEKFYVRRYSKRLYQINPVFYFNSNGKAKQAAHMMFIGGK